MYHFDNYICNSCIYSTLVVLVPRLCFYFPQTRRPHGRRCTPKSKYSPRAYFSAATNYSKRDRGISQEYAPLHTHNILPHLLKKELWEAAQHTPNTDVRYQLLYCSTACAQSKSTIQRNIIICEIVQDYAVPYYTPTV